MRSDLGAKFGCPSLVLAVSLNGTAQETGAGPFKLPPDKMPTYL